MTTGDKYEKETNMSLKRPYNVMLPAMHTSLFLDTRLHALNHILPTLHNVIFHTILDDFLHYFSAQIPFLSHYERFSQKQK